MPFRPIVRQSSQFISGAILGWSVSAPQPLKLKRFNLKLKRFNFEKLTRSMTFQFRGVQREMQKNMFFLCASHAARRTWLIPVCVARRRVLRTPFSGPLKTRKPRKPCASHAVFRFHFTQENPSNFLPPPLNFALRDRVNFFELEIETFQFEIDTCQFRACLTRSILG